MGAVAPAALREQLAGLYKDRLFHACEQLPKPETLTSPTDAVTLAIKSLAARCRQLDADAAGLERHIYVITAIAAPELRAVDGFGPDTAATLLTAIGDNPDQIYSDAAFAKLCGVCPLEASSGKTNRHRLNRGGNRDANRACTSSWLCACAATSPPADYIARRLAEGKTKNELMRCVKRYMAREIFHASKHQAEEPPNSLPEHRSIRDQGGGQLKVADGTTAIVWKIAACVARGVIESTKPTDEPLSQNPSPAILGLWFLNFGGWEPLPRVAPSQQSFILEGRTQTALAVYASSATR